MKRYRNEWKYYCNQKQDFILNSKLSTILKYDHNSKDGKYYVHSLYFDDYNNESAKTTEAGDSERFKWRIRYYNDDIKTLKLELKEKHYGRCYKESCPLTIEEYNAIMNNEISFLFWHTKKQLLKTFCLSMMDRLFTPKVIIDYERVAYVEDIKNIRITFDRNITSSYEIDKFLEGNYYKLPVSSINVLEVKFDDILPSYIKKIISSDCNDQTSFSKYYNGIMAGGILR